MYSFDIEIYKNFFSVVFIDFDTKSEFVFVRFEERDDIEKLKLFLKRRITLVGYNSISFDCPLLSAVIEGATNEELHALAQNIISGKADRQNLDNLKHITNIDLMRMLSLDVGLKQVGINLKHHLLQELPYDPFALIQPDQVDLLIEYNINDVLITDKMLARCLGDIELRTEVGKIYNIEVLNSSDSQIGNKTLNELYAQQTGLSVRQFENKKTLRTELKVADCIGAGIKFVSPEMKDFLEKLKTMTLKNPDKKGRFSFKEKVKVGKKIFDMGVGGIHTRDHSTVYETTDQHKIIDCDVTSYYPQIILNNKIKPKHIKPQFLSILKGLTIQRIKEKSAGNVLKATALKVTINAVFGKFGSDTFWLYDPLAFYSVTISGQLYLLMLADMLEAVGIKIISGNTDGLTAKVKIDQEQLYYDTCNEWMELTDFNLEYAVYKKYIRRDVNSYITQTDSGKIKTKGIFDDITSVGYDNQFSRVCSRKFNMPILAKALRGYFIDNVPVRKFVESHRDIYDFLISHKAAKKFDLFIKRPGQPLEKTSRIIRYYMPRHDGYEVVKIDPEKPETQLTVCATHWVKLGNDIDGRPIEDYQVDHDYYIAEIEKIINMIQPKVKQDSLF